MIHPDCLLRRRSRQQGVTLIEALVALMVMSFGMVALVALLGNLRRSTDIGKQRSEAMRLAQAEMSRMRAISTLQKSDPTDTSITDYENDLVSRAASTKTVADSNTTFTITTTVSELSTSPQLRGRTARVDVSWLDRASRAGDTAQTITLSSIIARVDPTFTGAVSLAPAPDVIRQPQQRQSGIPLDAVDLGNKTSAFRPSGLSSAVWVFNNTTGAITRVCSIDPADPLTRSIVDGASCADTMGFLISGTISFSNTSPANPAAPEATAFGLDMTITGGTYQAARLDIFGVPRKDANNNIIWDNVSVSGPNFQCFDDAPTATPTTQTFVNYSCFVQTFSGSNPPYWSGIVKLTGLNLGNNASDYRVCRYSADYNGNGNGYANVRLEPDNYEHPAFYVKVTRSLARQNFLVVKGNVSCPTAPAVNLSTGVFADYSTVQLQP